MINKDDLDIWAKAVDPTFERELDAQDRERQMMTRQIVRAWKIFRFLENIPVSGKRNFSVAVINQVRKAQPQPKWQDGPLDSQGNKKIYYYLQLSEHADVLTQNEFDRGDTLAWRVLYSCAQSFVLADEKKQAEWQVIVENIEDALPHFLADEVPSQMIDLLESAQREVNTVRRSGVGVGMSNQEFAFLDRNGKTLVPRRGDILVNAVLGSPFTFYYSQRSRSLLFHPDIDEKLIAEQLSIFVEAVHQQPLTPQPPSFR